MHRRIERPGEALDAPSLDLVGPVEIDEVYVSAGKRVRERDQESRSRGLSTRRGGSYSGDKPPVFIIADCGSGQRYVIPAKAADESTMTKCTPTLARATRRRCDGGSRPTEESPKTS